MSIAEQMLEMLQSGDLKGTSSLSMRNEQARTQAGASKIQKQERKKSLRMRLAVITEISIPFNPMTGKEDDLYNKTNKFRPALSASSVAAMCKAMADKNEESKATFMARAGVDSWDTTNYDEITKEDWVIFRFYRKARVFSIPVIEVMDRRVTGSTYNKKYLIKVNRDPISGDIIGEVPLALQVYNFHSNIIFEQKRHLDEVREKRKRGEEATVLVDDSVLKQLDLGTLTDDDYKENAKRIWKQQIVGRDRPANYVVYYAFPLNNKYEIDNKDSYASLTVDDMSKYLRFAPLMESMENELVKFEKGDYASKDHYFDFYELDMSCPDELKMGESQEAMELALKTTFAKADSDYNFKEFAHLDRVLEAIRKATDDDTTIEERLYASLRITPYSDDTIGDQLVQVLGETINMLDNPFVTEQLIQNNVELINEAFADADEIITRAALGETRSKGEDYTDKDVDKEAVANLNDILGNANGEEFEQSEVSDALAEAVVGGITEDKTPESKEAKVKPTEVEIDLD